MHLLGTSVLVFLLLPLVLSCESTNPKEAISEDYKNIIQKQLEHIKLSIQSKVNGTCGKRKLLLPHLLPSNRICTVSSFHLPLNISDQLQTELPNIRADINASLGCNCTINQTKHLRRWSEADILQKKLCRLKRLLMTIQNAYEQHNSAS